MAILGAYENKGEVVIEFRDHGPTRLSWRAALTRCAAVAQAETAMSTGCREPGIQNAVEQILAAARDARKKDPEQTGWRPPRSVSMYKQGNRKEIACDRRLSALGLSAPASSGIIVPGQ
jgi:hypothetical protein